MSSTVTEATYALEGLYQQYVVDTLDGSFQVFQSFTYGEMTIAVLLLLIFGLLAFKWIWEVLR